MDWYKSCAYDGEQKRLFHATGRKQLKALAAALGFEQDSFEIRSNQGGIAVSGEVILHHSRLYVQISQPATDADSGILIRTCKGRTDCQGGTNNFVPLRFLDHIETLAGACRRILGREGVRP